MTFFLIISELDLGYIGCCVDLMNREWNESNVTRLLFMPIDSFVLCYLFNVCIVGIVLGR